MPKIQKDDRVRFTDGSGEHDPRRAIGDEGECTKDEGSEGVPDGCVEATFFGEAPDFYDRDDLEIIS